MSSAKRSRGPDAFTIIELLIVIGIIAVLAGMLVPTLGGAKTKGQGIHCLNNLKQLQLGWALYSGDNTDKLVRLGNMDTLTTTPDDPSAHAGGTRSQWVLGTVNALPGATNVLMIQNGLLYSYVNNLNAYKCPADRKMVGGGPTVRSTSMNCWMNPIVSWNKTRGYTEELALREFRKQTDIIAPRPSSCWVLLDENPVSINDGFFVADPNQKTTWPDVPASYHRGAGGISFADAHAEMKKWRDRNVLDFAVTPAKPDPDSEDLFWLQERTTSLQ